MECTFRYASINDLEALLNLNKILLIDQWTKEKFQQIFQLDIPILIAINNSKTIVGCIIYIFCIEEVRILYCVINKKYRRKGIGSKLIIKTLIEAQNNEMKYALLETRITNLPAIQIYTKLGFRIINMRTNYYTDSIIEDAYIMEIKL
jgi:ribosomal-protein-alanine N-acetyltransferase